MAKQGITLKEVWAIENLISAEHTGNNYFLPSWETPYDEAYQGSTWSSEANLGGGEHGERTEGKAFSGVCASLVKKGWAECDGTGADAGIGVTREGWEAYQEWARVNLAEVPAPPAGKMTRLDAHKLISSLGLETSINYSMDGDETGVEISANGKTFEAWDFPEALEKYQKDNGGTLTTTPALVAFMLAHNLSTPELIDQVEHGEAAAVFHNEGKVWQLGVRDQGQALAKHFSLPVKGKLQAGKKSPDQTRKQWEMLQILAAKEEGLDLWGRPVVPHIATGRAKCRVCGQKIAKGEECNRFALDNLGLGNSATAIPAYMHKVCSPFDSAEEEPQAEEPQAEEPEPVPFATFHHEKYGRFDYMRNDPRAALEAFEAWVAAKEEKAAWAARENAREYGFELLQTLKDILRLNRPGILEGLEKAETLIKEVEG